MTTNIVEMRIIRSLPGEGKGGIVQFAFAGKTSMSVSVPFPPVIIRPVQ